MNALPHFCLSPAKHFLIKTIKYAKSSSISNALTIKSTQTEVAGEALGSVLSVGARGLPASRLPGTPSSGVIQRCRRRGGGGGGRLRGAWRWTNAAPLSINRNTAAQCDHRSFLNSYSVPGPGICLVLLFKTRTWVHSEGVQQDD